MNRTFPLAAFVATVLVFAPAARAHKPTTTEFTYHDDIYPIFEAKCGSCHRAGGVAPMSLLSYEEAYPWAVAIKNEVLNLAMPPWFADERYGSFRHRAALTAREMDTIVEWCLGGSPEGEPANERSARTADSGWPLGVPDVELSMDQPFLLGADTGEAVAEVVFSVPADAPRHLRAVDFRPESPNIVRSAMIYVTDGNSDSIDAGRLVASWLPDQPPQPMPEGRARLVGENAEIVLRVHYKKTWLDEGTAVQDRSRVALYFQDGAVDEIVSTYTVGTEAGDVQGELSGSMTLSRELVVLALLPKAGARVESLVAEAIRPDGARERLIRLRSPHPDWPRKFWLEEPVTLPPGSRVELRVTSAEQASLELEHVLLLDVVERGHD